MTTTTASTARSFAAEQKAIERQKLARRYAEISNEVKTGKGGFFKDYDINSG
jgi:hypothetical protein